MYLDLLHYLETTLLLVLLTLIFLLLSAISVFELERFGQGKSNVKSEKTFYLDVRFPTVLVAPLLIVAIYRYLNLSLFFPPALDLSFLSRLSYFIVPALLLLFASGLYSRARIIINQNYLNWMNKPCAQFSNSLGISTHNKLRRLLVKQSIIQSLQECLPWLFCELIIVEIIFNMPGLGLDLWNAAKARDINSFSISLGIIMAIFFIVVWSNAIFNKKLGEKLEGYI